MVDSELRALRDEAYETLRAGCRYLVAALIRPDRDPELETDRLHALLDGLAVHAAMRPDLNTPESMRAAVAGHLAGLIRGG